MNGVKIKVDTRILIFLSAFFFLLVEGANLSYPSNNESGGSGSMPSGMIKGSSTDPKTGIRTDAVRHPDGTTTITRFDSSGKMISQQTKRDPRSKPQPSKGKGWFGRPPGAMPVQKPAENPKDVVMSGNATDPKTEIRTEGVRLRDGTTTITQFDKDGNQISQTTKGGSGKDISVHPTDSGSGGEAGGGGTSQGPVADGKGQGESSKAAEINQWIKDTFGESGGVEMEIVDAEPIAPTSGADWNFLPNPNSSNNITYIGSEYADKIGDLVSRAEEFLPPDAVFFDSGRGDVSYKVGGEMLSSFDYTMRALEKGMSDAASKTAGKVAIAQTYIDVAQKNLNHEQAELERVKTENPERIGEIQDNISHYEQKLQEANAQKSEALGEVRAFEAALDQQVQGQGFESYQDYKTRASGQAQAPSKDKSEEGEKKTAQAEGGSHKGAGHMTPTLCAGSTCVVTVRFAPSAVGIRTSTLTISGSALSTDSDTIFYDADGSPLMPVDLKNQSKKLDKALDGFLKEGIKNPFQSSNALQLDGYLGKWSNSSSQASLADLFQGDTFGGAQSSTASTGSSCN